MAHGSSAPGSPRRTPARRRRPTPIRIVHGGLLFLFVLFTAAIGVRRAEAQTELTIAGCVVACSGAFTDFRSSIVCGACIVWGGRRLGEVWLGDEPIADFACAKANIDC